LIIIIFIMADRQDEVIVMSEEYDFFRGYTIEQRSRMTDEDMFDALYRPHEAEQMQKGKSAITHIGQVYDWHPELVTEEEIQVEELYRMAWKHDFRPYWWKDLLDSGDRSAAWRGSVIRWKKGMQQFSRANGLKAEGSSSETESYMAEKLTNRLPALGLNKVQLDQLEREAQDDGTTPLEKRAMFLFIRNTMLGQLISCDGASNLIDLIRILRVQLASGKPAPIPKWFQCSDGDFLGTGYHACENRDCNRTDTLDTELSHCAKCKLAVYCSRECQMADRKARHKICCREARDLNALYDSSH